MAKMKREGERVWKGLGERECGRVQVHLLFLLLKAEMRDEVKERDHFRFNDVSETNRAKPRFQFRFDKLISSSRIFSVFV